LGREDSVAEIFSPDRHLGFGRLRHSTLLSNGEACGTGAQPGFVPFATVFQI
jgi:hypothetical protein